MKTKKISVKAEPKVKTAKAPVARKCAAPKGKRVLFSVTARPGSKVYLAGGFNNWDAKSKKMIDKTGDGIFSVTITLPPGDHQYKFVIDDVWQADPECVEWVQNEHGTLNSVKRVE